MKKKMLALVFAVMITLSAVACGSDDVSTSTSEGSTQTEEAADAAEAATVETEEAEEEIDAMAAAQENAESVTSMEATMNMEMVMDATDKDGEQQHMESLMVMDMVTFSDPLKMKMEMSITGKDGEEEIQENVMSVYAETGDDGTTMMYLTDGESWQSGAANVGELEAYNAVVNLVDTLAGGYAFTLEGMEAVDGANAYKYAHTLTTEETKQVLLSSGALDNVASAGLDQSAMESALDDVEGLTEYIWIDEASLYPVKYEVDMTAAMDAMTKAMVESMKAEMGEEAGEVDLSFPMMKMSMTFSNFNNASDFSIPEEAKAN